MGAIDPGALRHELTLEQAMRTPDELGGFVEDWTTIATVFARIEPLRAGSAVRGDREVRSVTHRLTIRHRDDLTAAMRFRDGARVLAIVAVHDPDETGRHLQCLVRETPL